MKDNSCSFCNIERSTIVLSNESCFFIQVPQEVLIGSGLIIPKIHRESVFELTETEWKDTYKLLHQVKELLDDKYSPDGYNVGWNVGRVGGQEIFHAHLHVIPRFKEEPLANKGIRYWLKQEFNKRKF